jgi:hypothetical protein
MKPKEMHRQNNPIADVRLEIHSGICNSPFADLSATMLRKKAPNFEELARRFLMIVDAEKPLATVKAEPDGSLHAATALLTLCFGPDGAEAIAREMIREIELYDVEADVIEIDPLPQSRNAFLTDLLRREFSE